MYGVNFVIYLVTNVRIREAYLTFIRDMWRKICGKSEENQETVITSAFWIGLRDLEVQGSYEDNHM